MNCKNCGAEIKDGFLFCMHCGTKVEATDNDANAADESALDKTVGVTEEVIAPTVEEIPQATEEVAPQPVEEVAEDLDKTVNADDFNGGVELQPVWQEQTQCQEPQYQQPWEQPVPQKKKKKGGIAVAIISVILALGVVGVLLCASFSPIQVISSQNSPIQDLIDAYVKGETDGYALKKTTTYTRTYEDTDKEIVYEYTYAYGAYDFKTATRDFAMSKRSYSDGEVNVSYETPEYYYSYRTYNDPEGEYEYQRGSLEKIENHDKAEILRALSAKNYKELAAYLNRNLSIGLLGKGYPILDESGFDKCLRKLNRELKDEEYFNQIFGYEKYENGNGVSYSFDFDMIEVMEWLYSVVEENPDAFTGEKAHALALEYIRQGIDNLKEFYTEYRIVYEVEIEDGYIISSKDETIKEEKDGGKTTTVTLCEYSDHGDASVDKEVLSSFKSYKSKLGSNQEIIWDADDISIYDKDGNRVDN